MKSTCALCGYEFKENEQPEQYCKDCYSLMGCLFKLRHHRHPTIKMKVLNTLGLVEKEKITNLKKALKLYIENEQRIKNTITEIYKLIEQYDL